MTYRCKNKHRLNGVCFNYQKHKEPQKKGLKKVKSNFQTWDNIRLWDSKM
jgi:hypothetical protein